MNRPSSSVSAALLLVLLNALMWVVFGLLTAAGAIPSIPAGVFRWLLASLALACAALLVGIAAFLRRRNRMAYFLALGLLAGIALVAVADEFGPVDLVALLLDLSPIPLLLKDRAWYLG